MSQIPPLSIHPTSAEQSNTSQQSGTSNNPTQPRRITTNVTLNPRDSALDSLPSIHWSDLPKAPPNYLNNMEGVENGKKDGQGIAMEASNRNPTNTRNIKSHDGRSEMASHHAASNDNNQMVRPNNSSMKSFRNTSNEEYTPPPSQRTPPYKTGMPGYQPISPYHKRQQEKVEKSPFHQDASGRTVFKNFIEYF